jgi:hypothetical protein
MKSEIYHVDRNPLVLTCSWIFIINQNSFCSGLVPVVKGDKEIFEKKKLVRQDQNVFIAIGER